MFCIQLVQPEMLRHGFLRPPYLQTTGMEVGSAAQRGPAFTPGEPGPFPGGLPPNPACAVKRTGLSSVYAACATGFAWIQSWHGAHTTSVLRRVFAMSTAHAGWPGPGVPSCLRPATW